MHDVTVPRTVILRMQFRLLPDEFRPGYVVRHHGVTLVAIDPRSTRREVFDWVPSYLFTQERDVLRRAYGQPPVGQPMPLAEQGHLPIPTIIPADLRMPPGQFRDLEMDAALL